MAIAIWWRHPRHPFGSGWFMHQEWGGAYDRDFAEPMPRTWVARSPLTVH